MMSGGDMMQTPQWKREAAGVGLKGELFPSNADSSGTQLTPFADK